MAERLKKDKAKYKCAYTRTKTKLLMTWEGGMASKMQVMESLSFLQVQVQVHLLTLIQLQYNNNKE